MLHTVRTSELNGISGLNLI